MIAEAVYRNTVTDVPMSSGGLQFTGGDAYFTANDVSAGYDVVVDRDTDTDAQRVHNRNLEEITSDDRAIEEFHLKQKAAVHEKDVAEARALRREQQMAREAQAVSAQNDRELNRLPASVNAGARATGAAGTSNALYVSEGGAAVGYLRGQTTTTSGSSGLGHEAASLGLDLLPVVGSLKSVGQLYIGKDLVTGEPVNRWLEAGGILLGAVPGGKALVKGEKIIDVAETVGAKLTSTVGDLRAAGLKDAHHAIQDAAVRDLPGYNTHLAPGVQLQGPSTAVGTPHYIATQVQRQAGGGTLAAEMRIGYKGLRQAGYSESQARQVIAESEAYFRSIGATPSTPTRIPGNRK